MFIMSVKYIVIVIINVLLWVKNIVLLELIFYFK